VFHGRAIEKRREAGHRFDCERSAAARGLGYRRLQIPKNARGFGLAQRKKALTDGEQARDGLMEIGEDGAGLFDLKYAAGETEGSAMVDESAGMFGSGERRAEERIILRRGYGVQEIAAERGAAEARFTRGAEGAEPSIDLDPAIGVEIFRCGDSQPVRFAAENGFQNARFLKVGAEKFRQVGGLKSSLRGESFESEGMSERADGESGVREVAEAKISEVRMLIRNFGRIGRIHVLGSRYAWAGRRDARSTCSGQAGVTAGCS
jgi:hypothetical protein